MNEKERMTKPRVAILGLGIMGGGMANRLLANGFTVAVYNRNPERAVALASAGALVAGTPREAASRADVVISMVADDIASRNVWLGENGALAGAARGSVLIESSTLTVGWIKELANAAAQKGCEFLDLRSLERNRMRHRASCCLWLGDRIQRWLKLSPFYQCSAVK
jgi:3-hydroxyisobutyrate dehydrogenase